MEPRPLTDASSRSVTSDAVAQDDENDVELPLPAPGLRDRPHRDASAIAQELRARLTRHSAPAAEAPSHRSALMSEFIPSRTSTISGVASEEGASVHSLHSAGAGSLAAARHAPSTLMSHSVTGGEEGVRKGAISEPARHRPTVMDYVTGSAGMPPFSSVYVAGMGVNGNSEARGEEGRGMTPADVIARHKQVLNASRASGGRSSSRHDDTASISSGITDQLARLDASVRASAHVTDATAAPHVVQSVNASFTSSTGMNATTPADFNADVQRILASARARVQARPAMSQLPINVTQVTDRNDAPEAAPARASIPVQRQQSSGTSRPSSRDTTYTAPRSPSPPLQQEPVVAPTVVAQPVSRTLHETTLVIPASAEVPARLQSTLPRSQTAETNAAPTPVRRVPPAVQLDSPRALNDSMVTLNEIRATVESALGGRSKLLNVRPHVVASPASPLPPPAVLQPVHANTVHVDATAHILDSTTPVLSDEDATSRSSFSRGIARTLALLPKLPTLPPPLESSLSRSAHAISYSSSGSTAAVSASLPLQFAQLSHVQQENTSLRQTVSALVGRLSHADEAAETVRVRMEAEMAYAVERARRETEKRLMGQFAALATRATTPSRTMPSAAYMHADSVVSTPPTVLAPPRPLPSTERATSRPPANLPDGPSDVESRLNDLMGRLLHAEESALKVAAAEVSADQRRDAVLQRLHDRTSSVNSTMDVTTLNTSMAGPRIAAVDASLARVLAQPQHAPRDDTIRTQVRLAEPAPPLRSAAFLPSPARSVDVPIRAPPVRASAAAAGRPPPATRSSLTQPRPLTSPPSKSNTAGRSKSPAASVKASGKPIPPRELLAAARR